VPLVHTDVTLDVRGLAAAATVTQQYVNSSTEPIEAVYVFPLPHDSAVYDMEIRIGNRLIRSVIREREEAKRVYESAKSEGKRAALVEEERPNIFTASLANLMPGDHIEVRLRYVEPLRWEDGRIRLVFPMVVGPRLHSRHASRRPHRHRLACRHRRRADASQITPPVRNPDSRPGHDISLSVDLDSGFEFGSINSASHAITVRRLPDGRRHVELASGATIPNKDFALKSSRPKAHNQDRSFPFPRTRHRRDLFPPVCLSSTVQPVKRIPWKCSI